MAYAPNLFTDDEIDDMLAYLDRQDEPEEFFESICECGAEKTYGGDACHSDWCPKYEE